MKKIKIIREIPSNIKEIKVIKKETPKLEDQVKEETDLKDLELNSKSNEFSPAFGAENIEFRESSIPDVRIERSNEPEMNHQYSASANESDKNRDSYQTSSQSLNSSSERNFSQTTNPDFGSRHDDSHLLSREELSTKYSHQEEFTSKQKQRGRLPWER